MSRDGTGTEIKRHQRGHVAFGLITAAIAVSTPFVRLPGYPIAAAGTLLLIILGWAFYTGK